MAESADHPTYNCNRNISQFWKVISHEILQQFRKSALNEISVHRTKTFFSSTTYGDFIVWALADFHIERIILDDDFIRTAKCQAVLPCWNNACNVRKMVYKTKTDGATR